MTAPITITVRGQAKPTPRLEGRIVFPKRGKAFVHMYTPDTADAWKASIRRAFEPHWPAEPWDGPVSIDVVLWLPRLAEQYSSAWPRTSFPCIAASMGDWDNLGKAISDALNPVKEDRDAQGRLKRAGQPGLWRDDRQVVDARIRKLHHAIGYAPGARITAVHLVEQLSLQEA